MTPAKHDNSTSTPTTAGEPAESYSPPAWTRPRAARLARIGGVLLAVGVPVGVLGLVVLIPNPQRHAALAANIGVMLTVAGLSCIVFGSALLFVGVIGWLTLPYREGRCGRCGYNLTGNVSGVCPECGLSIATHDTPNGNDPAQFETECNDSPQSRDHQPADT